MSAIFDEISSKAMTLSPIERARLADTLIESLDDAPLSEIDATWISLAETRLDEIRNGTVKTIPAQQVIDNANRFLGR